MKQQIIASPRRDDSHGNTRNPERSPARWVPTLRKIPADSVPLGDSMTHRPYLWGAFHDEELMAWAATAPEARAKFVKAMRVRERVAEGNGQKS
jgi:hypothetical protein